MSKVLRQVIGAMCRVDRARIVGRCGGGAGRRAGQGRLQHVADRRRRAERTAAPADARDLARRRERGGRPARAPGRARLLRRSEQPGQCSRHLHQAPDGRQSRSPARSLRHQHGGAGHPGHHAGEQDDDYVAGDRREPPLQLRSLFLHGPGRPRGREGLLARLLRACRRSAAEAGDGRNDRGRCRILQDRHRRGEGERQGARLLRDLRPELSAEHDGFRADHAGRQGRQCRPGVRGRLSAGHGRDRPLGTGSGARPPRCSAER